MRRTILILLTVAIIFCGMQLPAQAISSPPFVAVATVDNGFWRGEPWPYHSRVEIFWLWDTDLSPVYSTSNIDYWSDDGTGIKLLDIAGLPILTSPPSGFQVRATYKALDPFGYYYDGLTIFATAGDVFLEMYLLLKPGTLTPGALPATLGNDNLISGRAYIDPGDFPQSYWNVNVNNVYTTPEPSTILLLGVGCAGALLARWGRKRGAVSNC